MIKTAAELKTIAKEWIEAWNAKDLDRIMRHYSDDVEFEADTVVTRRHKTDGKLKGQAELREHFRMGLSLAPQIHFTLEQVFTAPSGYAILYRRDNGNRVLDVVELNDADKAQKVKAYYGADQK